MAKGDIDSKKELLDVDWRSLMGVPRCPWRFLGSPEGSRSGSLGSRGDPRRPPRPRPCRTGPVLQLVLCGGYRELEPLAALLAPGELFFASDTYASLFLPAFAGSARPPPLAPVHTWSFLSLCLHGPAGRLFCRAVLSSLWHMQWSGNGRPTKGQRTASKKWRSGSEPWVGRVASQYTAPQAVAQTI